MSILQLLIYFLDLYGLFLPYFFLFLEHQQNTYIILFLGRNFKESLQKALVSLETGFSGLDQIFNLNTKQIRKKLKENIPNKILLVGEAIRKKINLNDINKLSKIDPWFLNQIKEVIEVEIKIKKKGLPKNFNEFNYIKISIDGGMSI